MVFEICESASSPKTWCEFYYFLTLFSKTKNILEIGTNLGISGQYYLQALQNNSDTNNTQFFTMEGVEGLCEIAENRFKEISTNSNNFKIFKGLYDDNLQEVISTNTLFDLIFIDGNHRFEPTLKYYKELSNNFADNCIIIFDDINWSAEMRNAWSEIKKTNYFFSIDFYKLSILVINKEMNLKKDFKLFLSF